MRTRNTASAVCVVVLAAAILAITTDQGLERASAQTPTGGGYQLLYADEFNTGSLDTGSWSYRTGTRLGGLNLPENVRVGPSDPGVSSLHIDFDYEAIADTPTYTGGGIISRRDFGYGYYEVRARLYGASKGFHQSFWSMGVKSDPEVAAGGDSSREQLIEIDGFEVDSVDADHVATNLHYYPTGSGEPNIMRGGQEHAVNTTGWFTAAYEWLPGRVNLYVDDVRVRTIYVDEAFAPQKVWITGLPTPDLSPGAVPPDVSAQMEVDYFRFYGAPNRVNRLGNSGFNDGAASNLGVPLIWNESGAVGASSLSAASPYEGSHALRHSGSTAYTVTTQQDTGYIPNGTYRLTAKVRSSGGQSSAAMQVSGHGGSAMSAAIPLATTWTEIAIDNIPVSSKGARIGFTSQAAGGQWLEVDDVHLYEVAAADSLDPRVIIADNLNTANYAESPPDAAQFLDSGLYGHGTTRYAGPAESRSAWARWTPSVAVAGMYDTYIHTVVYPGTDPAADIDIAYDGGTASRIVNFSTGTSGWAYLGRFPFAAGMSGTITNTLNTNGTVIRADAVMLRAAAVDDQFDASLPPQWTFAGGSWTVSGGRLLQSQVTADGYAIKGNPAWRDYLVASDVTLTSPNGYAGVVSRYTGPNDFYHCRVNDGYDRAELLKRVAGVWTLLDYQSVVVTPGTTYRIELQSSGPLESCVVNGAVWLVATSELSLSTGVAGVRSNQASAQFDNIQVWSRE